MAAIVALRAGSNSSKRTNNSPRLIIVALQQACTLRNRCHETYLDDRSLIVAAMPPAFAQETVPYASRPPVVGDTYVPTLGDIMGATQLRHFKLWYAGELRNWELASYELGQIEDSLINAARLYQNIPVRRST